MYKRYDYEFAGGLFNSYFFVTDNNAAYEIKFKTSSYLFPDEPLFRQNTYEFVIDRLEIANGKVPPDDRIGFTIAAIFDDFYERQKESITIYICDTSDSKHWARQRKFSAWFLLFKNDAYFKSEAVLVSEDGEIVPISIVLRRDNPHRDQILKAFLRVADGYTTGQK